MSLEQLQSRINPEAVHDAYWAIYNESKSRSDPEEAPFHSIKMKIQPTSKR